jgi:hypothetical protein
MISLDELLKRRNLEELRVFDQFFKVYEDALQKFYYLKNVTESFIFTAYNAVLLHDTEKCFPHHFTQQDMEIYYRLKFRALNSTRVNDSKNYYKSVRLFFEL